MPTGMICECGARFSAEDSLAGREVPCPECRTLLLIPATPTANPQTSLLAVASLILAVTGAFTVVGTAAAALLGAVALWVIRRNPTRLAGVNLAYAAIAIGLVFTPLTVALLLLGPPPVSNWLRSRVLSGQIESRTGTAFSRDQICRLDYPDGWGQLRMGHGSDPAIDGLQDDRDLLLAHLWHRAYIDLARDTVNIPGKVSDYEPHAALSLQINRRDQVAASGPFSRQGPLTLPEPLQSRPLQPVEHFRGHEWTFEVKRAGRTWRFLIRAYRAYQPGKRITPAVFILRGYAPLSDFVAVEKELRATLDGVQFTP